MKKLNRNKLIEKLADQITEGADLDSLEQYFREGQVAFLEDMSDKDLVDYANEYLGYNVEEEL